MIFNVIKVELLNSALININNIFYRSCYFNCDMDFKMQSQQGQHFSPLFNLNSVLDMLLIVQVLLLHRYIDYDY